MLLGSIVLLQLLILPLCLYLQQQAHAAATERLLEHLRETERVGGETQAVADRKLSLDERRLIIDEKRVDLAGELRSARVRAAANGTSAAELLGGS